MRRSNIDNTQSILEPIIPSQILQVFQTPTRSKMANFSDVQSLLADVKILLQ